VRAVERCQLRRQGAEMAGMDPVSIDVTFDFHAAIGQVVDPALVADVAVDGRATSELDGLDDERGVLVSPFPRQWGLAAQDRRDDLVGGATPLRPVVALDAALA